MLLRDWRTVVVLAGIGFVAAAACGSLYVTTANDKAESIASAKRAAAALPGERQGQYASSNTCRACHPGEYESWHQTFHRTMTHAATAESVVGSFDGTTIKSDGLEYRVFERDGEFWAEMPDPEEYMYVIQGGKPTPLEEIPRVERRVVMTTGSHHYQTYWVTGDRKYGNLLQTLPLVYLIEDQRWIPREAAFMRPPVGNRMVSQWNHHCIRCHSTGGNPGLDPKLTEGGGFKTQVAELGISCEACHGPAEEHIAYYQNPMNRYASHFGMERPKSIVNPVDLDHRRGSQVCGQCHAVFVMDGKYAMKYAFEGVQYRPGDDLHEFRYCIQHPLSDGFDQRDSDLRQNPSFFRDRWWDDGRILAGGREFTAMSAAPCYLQGEMSCFNCHTMHHGDPNDQLKPGMDTSAACTSCHREPRFTTNIASHTHHLAESVGSNCLNCHMPHTTYALFNAIRSHQIASPSAGSSIRHHVPNACNLCHLDQTLAWTQLHLTDWYGQKYVPLDDDQREVAAGVLWMAKGNAAVRAITVWHAGWAPAIEACGDDWLAPHVAALLSDPYGVVRYIAHRSLQTLPGYADYEYDFLGGRREWLEAADRAAVLWNDSPSADRKRGDHLLIDSNGQLQVDRLLELLRRRDNRPVMIKE